MNSPLRRLSVALLLGAALALFGLNIVASLSYGQLSEAALQEAFYWGILFLYFVLHGPGLLSADALLSYLLRRRKLPSADRWNECGIKKGETHGKAEQNPQYQTDRRPEGG